jgi:hypothetical protein
MYSREPPICADAAGREAYALWCAAAAAEESDPAGAVTLYRRAKRASPAFAELMGLA